MKCIVFSASFLIFSSIALCAMQTEEPITYSYQAIEKDKGHVSIVETDVIDAMPLLQKVLKELSFAQQVRLACASKECRLKLEKQYKFCKKSKNIFLLEKTAHALTVLIATTVVKKSTSFIRADKVELYKQYNQCFEKIMRKIDVLKRLAVEC
jgi:hypothetical protein